MTFGFIGLFQCNQKSKCRTVYLSYVTIWRDNTATRWVQWLSVDPIRWTSTLHFPWNWHWYILGRNVQVAWHFNKPRFFVLSKLAKTLLVLPNSNADSERAFSLVKKIATEFRADLNKDTLCALLSCKMNTHLHCYELKPSAVLLKNAKSATMEYNNSLK